MTQLLPSRPQPTLIATILPLLRVSHHPVGAAVSAKHLGKLKQASMLKSGSIYKQQKGTIFPIWFSPLRHSLSHSQCWEQSCILMAAHLCLQGTAVPALPLAGGGTWLLCLSRRSGDSHSGCSKRDTGSRAGGGVLGWHFLLFLLLQPGNPPLLLFFRLFFQPFQPCGFMATLFNPPIIRGPITPAQDAS